MNLRGHRYGLAPESGPPMSMPSPGPLPQGRPAEVRAAEIIAGPLIRIAAALEQIAGTPPAGEHTKGSEKG